MSILAIKLTRTSPRRRHLTSTLRESRATRLSLQAVDDVQVRKHARVVVSVRLSIRREKDGYDAWYTHGVRRFQFLPGFPAARGEVQPRDADGPVASVFPDEEVTAVAAPPDEAQGFEAHDRAALPSLGWVGEPSPVGPGGERRHQLAVARDRLSSLRHACPFGSQWPGPAGPNVLDEQTGRAARLAAQDQQPPTVGKPVRPLTFDERPTRQGPWFSRAG